jgi:hypothetical protein
MEVDTSPATGDVPLAASGADEPNVSGPNPGTDLVPIPKTEPGATVLDLALHSARLGLDAGRLMAGELAGLSLRVGRAVLPPAIAGRPIAAMDEELVRRRDAARVRQELALESTKGAAETVLNRMVVGVVDMLDMGELIDHVPVDEVVARVDVAGVVDEIDLGGIVRQSTTGLGGESLDALRVEVMGLDFFGARLVDKLFRRKSPRDLSFDGYDVGGSEVHVPKALR